MSLVTIAVGEKWGVDYVKKYLVNLSCKKKEVEYFRIETLFARMMTEYDANAEWSVKYAEVIGEPECIQFDIDHIRDKAIEAFADRYT
jgi:hypothetical protein